MTSFFGGSAVAHGSYGCVFSPGIPCKGDSAGVASGAYNNTVSKVMMPEPAQEEYAETQNVRALRDSMPVAMRDAIVVPLRAPCEVEFTPADLKNSAAECSNFQNPIRSNLGKYASKVRSLTQVNGGPNVDRTLQAFTADTFKRVNTGLMALTDVLRTIGLHGGIHGDIKGVNLVFNPADNKVRIIDWGFFQFLSADYVNARWKNQGFDTAPGMFNEMLSTWLYTLDMATVPEPSSPLTTIVDWASRAFLAWFNSPGFEASNQGHLGKLDEYLLFWLNSATRLGVRNTIKLPSLTTARFAPLSLELSNIIVAHAVAMVQAGLKMRLRFFVDTVLRMNQDIFGALTCYFRVSEIFFPADLQTLASRVAYTAGRYMFDPKYAVEPFNLAEMHASFRELNADSVAIVPFPAPRDVGANVAIMNAADPHGVRAFNPDTFDEAAFLADKSGYNMNQVYRAMAPPVAASRPAKRVEPDSGAVPPGSPTAAATPRATRAKTTGACFPGLVPLQPSPEIGGFGYCTISGGGSAFGMTFIH